jgi:hypothetical protein
MTPTDAWRAARKHEVAVGVYTHNALRNRRVGDVDCTAWFGAVREPKRVIKFRPSRREPRAR